MSSDEANALAALNQFIMPNLQQSPSKMQPMDETLHRLMQGLPIFNQLIQSNSPSSPVETQTQLHPQQHQQQTTATQAAATPTIAVHEENPSSSESSESPRQGTPSNEQADQNSFAIAKDIKGLKNEGWYECFSTTKAREFDALIYSLYVMDKNDRKIDGYMYYECINRLQNKCRYKVRVKQKDEFYIVEERGGHNHAMEPVGQAGSHAGLPKTLREIVDKSFHEDWTPQQRQTKIDEEVRRMGLPPNPRLGRQVDNRMAYLRRVKNLNETKKIQDQLQAATPMGIESGLPQMMQMLLEQQGQGGGPMLENAATAEEMSAAQEMLQRFMAMAGGAVDMGDNSEMPMLDFNAANAFLSAGGVPVTPQGE